jgi:N-acetylmuramoyl-L-alanine amidase
MSIIQELIDMGQMLVVALTILGEADGEPWAGKVMVAEVIVNRANASGKTLKEVCLAPKQFSCWNGKTAQQKLVNRTANYGTLASQSWRDCIRIARDVCQEGYKTTTPAMFYFNPKLANPKWAKSKRHVATVGEHQFYAAK